MNLRVWRHALRLQWICMRSKPDSGAYVTFNCTLTSNLISQPLTSYIFIETSKGYTCLRIDLLPHTYSSWPLRMVLHPKLISQSCFDFHWLGATAFLLDLQKIATESLLLVTHHWYFNWGKTSFKVLIYLIRNGWPNTSYVLISHFSNWIYDKALAHKHTLNWDSEKNQDPSENWTPGPLDVRSRTLPLRHTGSQQSQG